MANDVANEIYHQTFQERMSWIEKTRKVGNDLVGQNELEKAIDEYMKCLVALDFNSVKGKKPSDDQIKMTEIAVKIPVLNNIALALNKQGEPKKAIDMLD